MRAADTNVLVRLIARDDEAQYNLAREFVASGAWISQLVLLDAAVLLRRNYGFNHAAVAQAIELILNHEQLVIEDPDVVAAALVHYRRSPALGFSDCLILEIARKAGHLPLGTFDRTLGKIDGAEKL